MQRLTRQLNVLYPSLPENNFFFTFERSALSISTDETKNALIIRNCGDKLVWHYFDRYDEKFSRHYDNDLRSISIIEFKDKTEVIFNHNNNVATSFYFSLKALLMNRLDKLMSDTLQTDAQSIRQLYTSQDLSTFYEKIDESIAIIKTNQNIESNDFDALNNSDLYFLQSIKTLLQANPKLLTFATSIEPVKPAHYEEMDIVDEKNEFKRLFHYVSRVKIHYHSLCYYLENRNIQAPNLNEARSALLTKLNTSKSALFRGLIEEVERFTLLQNLNLTIPVISAYQMRLENAGVLIGNQYFINDNTLRPNKKPDEETQLLDICNLRFDFDLDNIEIVLNQEPECRYVFRDKTTSKILPDLFYFLDEEKYSLFYKKMARIVKETQLYTIQKMRLQIDYQQLFEKVRAEMSDFMNNVSVINNLIDDYLDKNTDIEVV
jgi:hypothetical protein